MLGKCLSGVNIGRFNRLERQMFQRRIEAKRLLEHFGIDPNTHIPADVYEYENGTEIWCTESEVEFHEEERRRMGARRDAEETGKQKEPVDAEQEDSDEEYQPEGKKAEKKKRKKGIKELFKRGSKGKGKEKE